MYEDKNASAKIVLPHIGPFNLLEVSHTGSLVKGRRNSKVRLVRPRSNQMAFYYFWSCLTKIHGDDHVVLNIHGSKMKKSNKKQ